MLRVLGCLKNNDEKIIKIQKHANKKENVKKMKIRKATKKDAGEIAKLWVEFEKYQDTLWKGEKKKLNDVFEKTKPNVLKLLEKEILSHLKLKTSVYFIAEVDKEIIGYLSVSIQKSFQIHKLEKTGRLHYAYIKKEYRRQGIFTLLLGKAKKWFKQKGIKYWTLSVSAINPSLRKAYQKLGFMDKEIEMIGKIK